MSRDWMRTPLRDARHFPSPGYEFRAPPGRALGILAGTDIEAEDLLLIAILTLWSGMIAYHIPLTTRLTVQGGARGRLDV
ncbi:hypothetical protein F1880_001677 [Penicillium rolfsii]|nr:hypothetical protein F1880_001677 [Penicillium rolfsii]